MQKMTLSQFLDFTQNHPFSRFRYLSENQKEYRPYDTVQLSLSFQTVRVSAPHRIIALHAADHSMVFTHVVCVLVDEPSELGVFATVLTNDLDREQPASYQLLLQ